MEAAAPEVRRMWEAPSRPQRLPLFQLAGATLLRQERSDPLRGVAKLAILFVVLC